MADTAIRPRIATVSGVFARPGVSKNRRLYTTPMIVAAVKEMQKDLAEGNGPTLVDRRALDMGTHHNIGTDGVRTDILRIVGKVTTATVDEATGVARFTADIPDTAAGRDIAALVTPEKPYVKGVSFLGNWTGPERIVRAPDGQPAETADGFVVKRIDYTNESGILGAEIDSADLELTEGAGLGKVICESAEEVLLLSDQISEAGTTAAEGGNAPGDGAKPYGDETYADPGWQSDKKKRYPLTKGGKPDKKRIRAAWSYINVEANAAKYSANQVKRIKSRIQKAATKAGVDVKAEASTLAAAITEALEEHLEAVGEIDGAGGIGEAYASVNLDNNAVDVRVAGYISDPSQLAAVGERFAAGALAALATIDPDNDGDVDIPGGDDEPECPNCGCDIEITWNCCPLCGQELEPQAVPEGAPTERSSAVGEATSSTAGEGATSTAQETPELKAAKELLAKPEIIEAARLLEEANAAGGETTATGAADDPKAKALAEAKQKVADAAAELKAIEEGSATSGAAVDVNAIVEAVSTKVLEGIGQTVASQVTEAFTKEVGDFREAALAGGHLRPWRKGLVAEAGAGTAGAGADDYDPAKATPAEFDAHRGATYARMLGLDTPAAQAAAADAVAATA